MKRVFPLLGLLCLLEYAGPVAIREGRWKLIPGRVAGGKKASAKRGPKGGPALHNLDADPAESDNVAGQHRDVVRPLSRKLEHLRGQGRSRP